MHSIHNSKRQNEKIITCLGTKFQKSNLHHTRLIPFRVSRVSGAHLRGFANSGESLETCGRFYRPGQKYHTVPSWSRCLTTCAIWLVAQNFIWHQFVKNNCHQSICVERKLNLILH